MLTVYRDCIVRRNQIPIDLLLENLENIDSSALNVSELLVLSSRLNHVVTTYSVTRCENLDLRLERTAISFSRFVQRSRLKIGRRFTRGRL